MSAWSRVISLSSDANTNLEDERVVLEPVSLLSDLQLLILVSASAVRRACRPFSPATTPLPSSVTFSASCWCTGAGPTYACASSCDTSSTRISPSPLCISGTPSSAASLLRWGTCVGITSLHLMGKIKSALQCYYCFITCFNVVFFVLVYRLCMMSGSSLCITWFIQLSLSLAWVSLTRYVLRGKSLIRFNNSEAQIQLLLCLIPY